MKTCSSLKTCIGGFVAAVARATRKNTITVYKWTEPHDDFSNSGNHNPLDTMEEIIDSVISAGQDRKNALAPLDYLELRYGRISIDIIHTTESIETVNAELLVSIREFGHLCEEVGKALADKNINWFELQKIEIEGMHVIQSIACLIKKAEQEAAQK